MIKSLKRTFGAFISYILFYGYSWAIETRIPHEAVSDPDFKSPEYEVNGRTSILDVINFANGILWWLIGIICFIFMIRNGFQLIMARGDSAKMKELRTALLGWGIGFVVCISAPSIVELVVGLLS